MVVPVAGRACGAPPRALVAPRTGPPRAANAAAAAEPGAAVVWLPPNPPVLHTEGGATAGPGVAWWCVCAATGAGAGVEVRLERREEDKPKPEKMEERWAEEEEGGACAAVAVAALMGVPACGAAAVGA